MRPKFYRITVYIEELGDGNPVWGIVMEDREDEAEASFIDVVTEEYGVSSDMTILEIREAEDDDFDFVDQHPIYCGVWI